MSPDETPDINFDPCLEEVRLRFEDWRRAKKWREKTPPELLDAAASLTHKYSVWQVSHLVPVSYERLKAHISSKTTEQKSQPIFIEASLRPAQASETSLGVHSLELTAADGSLMKITWLGSGYDPLPLCQAFWQRSR